AGNVLNEDILGSLEYAADVAGVKLILVLGHTRCGAVGAACTGVELGHVTGLLRKLERAVEAGVMQRPELERSCFELAELVARIHVQHVMADMRCRSSIIRDLE